MKKIVLGCAAVLLSLGLLAGCNNDAPIEDAVIINVDSEATVIVGESLELPYTVSPEKADVVAASDNESIVTAEAQDGTLYLQGVAEGSAVVTLVGTYKKYAEANKNITVKVITEAEAEQEPGPGVPDTGGDGSGSGIGGALPEELEGEWLLGYTSGETNYYFNGEVESSFYGGVTTSDFDAVVVTATAVSDGATLTFEDDGATEYIYMDESSGHHNFSWSEEPFTWKYDEVYETFVADDSEGAAYFMGNYGTQYQELRMSEYGYLTGEITSSNEQFAAHLYEIPTYATPESITITGENTVAVYERITLTATIQPDNADPRLTWSWATKENSGEVTVSSTGVVTGVAEGTVTVTATSVADEAVSGSIDITVTAATGDAPTAYKLGSLDTTNYCYYWFNGKTTVVSGSTFLATSANWDDAVDVYITAVDDSTENTCTLSFYNDSEEEKYITCTSNATSITLGNDPCTWVWNENSDNGYFSAAAEAANGRFIGESGDGSFRAYAASNLDGYPHVQPFTEKPADPEKPEQPDLEEVTSITSGKSYYLGAQSGDDYQLITGTVTSYKLPTTMDISEAAEVVVTGDDSGWTLTINGSYIYAYVYNSTTLELGMSNNATVPNSGVNVFNFDSSSHAFYTDKTGAVTSSYTYSYLEYYSGNVTLYGSSSLSFSNAAHLYQVVDS